MVLAGSHATGTITGHHLIEIVPLFLVLFSIIISHAYQKFYFLRENIITLLIILILFIPPINLTEYKEKIKVYSIKDKKNINIEIIKNYLNNYISGPEDTIYIHQRDAELVLNLKMRTASDFHINTFLYNSYDDGSPIIENIEKVKKQILESQPKVIILLNNYLNEAPYIERIDYFDEILKKYRLDRTIDKYNFFVLVK